MSFIIDTECKQLLASKAIEAREKSYSPYSHTAVGAALLTKSGKIYTGANIENAAYSPTICAERVAIFSAIHAGERGFVAIAVAGGASGMPALGDFPPCGVCRQVMAEFCSSDFIVLLAREDGYFETTLRDLLPNGFGPGFFNKETEV